MYFRFCFSLHLFRHLRKMSDVKYVALLNERRFLLLFWSCGLSIPIKFAFFLFFSSSHWHIRASFHPFRLHNTSCKQCRSCLFLYSFLPLRQTGKKNCVADMYQMMQKLTCVSVFTMFIGKFRLTAYIYFMVIEKWWIEFVCGFCTVLHFRGPIFPDSVYSTIASSQESGHSMQRISTCSSVLLCI